MGSKQRKYSDETLGAATIAARPAKTTEEATIKDLNNYINRKQQKKIMNR